MERSDFRPEEIAFYAMPKIYEAQPSGRDLIDDYRRINEREIPFDGGLRTLGGTVLISDTDGADDFISIASVETTERLPGGNRGSFLDGGAGSDYLAGNEGVNLIFGSDGDDIIAGNGGNDSIIGGEGADVISGGAGDDVLVGVGAAGDGLQNDVLYGGQGGDRFDLVYRGQEYGGKDAKARIMDFNPGEGDRIGISQNLDEDERLIRWNGEATEIIDIRGLPDAAVEAVTNLENGRALSTLENSDELLNSVIAEVYSPNGRGEASNFVELFRSQSSDVFEALDPTEGSFFRPEDVSFYQTPKIYEAQPSGQDLIDDYRRVGGDPIPFERQFITLSEDLLTPETVGTDDIIGATSSELRDSVFVDGQAGSDYVFGARNNDRLIGGDGDDIIAGLEGDDSLVGGAGIDVISGGAGNDILSGIGDFEEAERQDDILYGGQGGDRFDLIYRQQEYANQDGFARIMDFNPDEEDKFGVAEDLLSDDNLFARWNGEATELIDLRELSESERTAVRSLEAGASLGSIDNFDRSNSVIAEVYSPNGRGQASDFSDLLNSDRARFFEATAGLEI